MRSAPTGRDRRVASRAATQRSEASGTAVDQDGAATSGDGRGSVALQEGRKNEWDGGMPAIGALHPQPALALFGGRRPVVSTSIGTVSDPREANSDLPGLCRSCMTAVDERPTHRISSSMP